jgi:hypothetical protein
MIPIRSIGISCTGNWRTASTGHEMHSPPALEEYNETCTPHDAEMDGIRDALLAKFGRVPLLDTYRQMAIRHQKATNWNAAIWWAKRGLSLYGQQAARPEAVEDLEKRVAAYETKLSKQSSMAPQITRDTGRTATQGPTETLTCLRCEDSFERTVTRGRKTSELSVV